MTNEHEKIQTHDKLHNQVEKNYHYVFPGGFDCQKISSLEIACSRAPVICNTSVTVRRASMIHEKTALKRQHRTLNCASDSFMIFARQLKITFTFIVLLL